MKVSAEFIEACKVECAIAEDALESTPGSDEWSEHLTFFRNELLSANALEKPRALPADVWAQYVRERRSTK